jgi:hypothetical protein
MLADLMHNMRSHLDIFGSAADPLLALAEFAVQRKN